MRGNVALVMCALAAGTVSAQEQSSARVYGRVVESSGERPIPEVRVSLAPGTLATITSPNGRFALLDIPFGRYTIRFERPGYEARTARLVVGPGDPIEINVKLATSPIQLDPIEVVVRSRELDRVGFYDRRDSGPQGTFFTQRDIERLVPTVMTDLLHRIPSAIVVDGGPGRKLLRFNRTYGTGGSLPGCEPAVFLDGALIQDQSSEPRLLNFNRVMPADVAAIEVYIGANSPLQYRRTPCGAVLLWTKRGG